MSCADLLREHKHGEHSDSARDPASDRNVRRTHHGSDNRYAYETRENQADNFDGPARSGRRQLRLTAGIRIEPPDDLKPDPDRDQKIGERWQTNVRLFGEVVFRRGIVPSGFHMRTGRTPPAIELETAFPAGVELVFVLFRATRAIPHDLRRVPTPRQRQGRMLATAIKYRRRQRVLASLAKAVLRCHRAGNRRFETPDRQAKRPLPTAEICRNSQKNVSATP